MKKALCWFSTTKGKHNHGSSDYSHLSLFDQQHESPLGTMLIRGIEAILQYMIPPVLPGSWWMTWIQMPTACLLLPTHGTTNDSRRKINQCSREVPRELPPLQQPHYNAFEDKNLDQRSHISITKNEGAAKVFYRQVKASQCSSASFWSNSKIRYPSLKKLLAVSNRSGSVQWFRKTLTYLNFNCPNLSVGNLGYIYI